MHKKVQELEKWGQNLIDTFRKEYEKLNELEQKQILDYSNYSAPCQIEIFWVSEPHECQLLVFLHDSDRPDKEIKINGPFKGFELEEEVIKIMDEPRWEKEITNQEDDFRWYHDENQMNKYSDYFVLHFSNFLDIMRNYPLTNFRNGLRYGSAFFNNGWVANFKGNVAELGYFEQKMIESFQYAKRRALIRNETVIQKPSSQSITHDRSLVGVIGAYYYPGVFIGNDIEISFKEKLYGPNIVEYPKYEFEFTFDGRKGFYDKYGFVVIQIEDEESAIKIINTIFGISLILGIESLSVRESGLISSKIKQNIPVLGDSIGGCSWNSANQRFKPMNFKGYRKTVIPLDKMNEIIKTAEIIYSDKKLNDLVLFLLDSYTHLKSLEFSQSFLFSWFIVENLIPRLFAEVISEKNEMYGQNKKADKYDNWSIATKIEFLSFLGKIDNKKYEFLNRYKKKRNDFVHKGIAISKSDSEKLYNFSFDSVKNEICKNLNNM
ncbi:MAG: hypothetical protein EMLJLAPB_00031 [Candidatus Argoarchaeum ethanivorans]|uniref:Apea-like HEPN domain-containing protein n=1 Tax=Candidatus Argoarchaeum ethanivorans TaxID=2608793 RepID=A0A811T3B8_9EURY|nr:MAG: hypothetical protein EMLJLAPB_00031 [Candidatus Argoarchaeum ethanivorans]CAD6493713.1 MAG: hypothetical protein FFODKBPE_00555 [Candidatus Argoarchaeum ethanivorans]